MVTAGSLSADVRSKRMRKKTKVGKVMHEFKAGTLHSGSKSGPKVKDRKQAIAIGMSEAGKSMPKGMKGKKRMRNMAI